MGFSFIYDSMQLVNTGDPWAKAYAVKRIPENLVKLA